MTIKEIIEDLNTQLFGVRRCLKNAISNRKKSWRNYNKYKKNSRLRFAVQADENVKRLRKEVLAISRKAFKLETRKVSVNSYVDNKKYDIKDKEINSNTAKACLKVFDMLTNIEYQIK